MSNHTHTAPDEPFELEPLDTPRHTQIGLWLSFRSDLSPTARQLYVIMAGFVNHHRRTQGDTSAWPSLEMLAILLTLSRGDKVTPYMDELIWIGAVAKRTRHTQGGMRARNIYGIRFNPPPGSNLPEGIDDILEPHRKVMRETNSKGLAEYMSTRAKATKEEIKRRRAQAKASRTGKTQTCPTPPSTPSDQGLDQDNPYPRKQGYGPTSANGETPGQPVPPDSGVRTPQNRGSVPPKTGVELYEGRTTRSKENLPSSSDAPDGGGGAPVSDDGTAVADALSGEVWNTDGVRDALPERARPTGPGLERIAARCRELQGWGLSHGEICKLLAGAPKNNPDKALLRRTATAEDARKALSSIKDQAGEREDVDRVCEYLADTVATLGFTRPEPTRDWYQAARMMIDSDRAPSVDEHGNPISKKITADAIVRMIDWVARDPFWGGKGNIRSMPTLRKQFETLAAQARQKSGQGTSTGPGGYRPKHVKDEEIERYAGTLEMSLDYVLGIDDPEYRKDLADARVSGGEEGVVAFRERIFGPRSGWSVRVSREHLVGLFARVRDAGYRLDEDASHTRPLKKSWAESLAQEEGALPEELDAFRQRSEAEEAERVRAKQKAAGAALLAQLGYGPAPQVEAGTA